MGITWWVRAIGGIVWDFAIGKMLLGIWFVGLMLWANPFTHFALGLSWAASGIVLGGALIAAGFIQLVQELDR